MTFHEACARQVFVRGGFTSRPSIELKVGPWEYVEEHINGSNASVCFVFCTNTIELIVYSPLESSLPG